MAKQRISDIYLSSIAEKGFVAPLMICSSPGKGKTRFMEAIKQIAKTVLGRKTIHFATGREMGTPTTLAEDYILPHMVDKPSIMLIDEFHLASDKNMDLMLSMIEVTAKREVKEIKRGDFTIPINPLLNSFVVCTNRHDLIQPALMSRFERIDLKNYSDVELEQILFQGLEGKDIRFHENTLRQIASCMRGSARDAISWLNACTRHAACAGKNTISKQDVAEIIMKRESLPRGVTQHELNTLLILEKYGEQQLKELSSKNHCANAEQQRTEGFLMSLNLITVE